MIPFKSPICSEHIWYLCLKTNKEIEEIYYSNNKKKEQDKEIHGIIEYITSTIYIDKNLDDVLFVKEIRKQLMRIYLYDTGMDDILYSEENFCDVVGVAAPLICNRTDEIISEIKKERRRKYEKLTK